MGGMRKLALSAGLICLRNKKEGERLSLSALLVIYLFWFLDLDVLSAIFNPSHGRK